MKNKIVAVLFTLVRATCLGVCAFLTAGVLSSFYFVVTKNAAEVLTPCESRAADLLAMYTSSIVVTIGWLIKEIYDGWKVNS